MCLSQFDFATIAVSFFIEKSPKASEPKNEGEPAPRATERARIRGRQVTEGQTSFKSTGSTPTMTDDDGKDNRERIVQDLKKGRTKCL